MIDEKQEAKEYRAGVKRERLAAESRHAFIRAALTHSEGRAFFYWLLAITGCEANPFTQHALTTSFNCGKLEIGKMVKMAIVEATPELYLEMLKEQEDARSKPANGHAADTGTDDEYTAT